MTDSNHEISRLSGLIPQQLLADSEALTEFLKEYYTWLNREEQGPSWNLANALVQRDLTTALDKYIELIRKEIGYSIPKGSEIDLRNLLANVRPLYNAKGSVESFRALFRVLYNKEIDIFLPKDQILIASDGRWSQQTSIFVAFEPANDDNLQLTVAEIEEVFGLAGKVINLVTSTRTVSVEVERVRKSPVTDTYEIFISKNYTGVITTGATLANGTLNGVTVNGMNQFEINSGGANFKVGQIFDLYNVWDGYSGYDDNGTTFKVKVSSVDTNGAITGLDFLSFGLNYITTTAEATAAGVLVPNAEPAGDSAQFSTSYNYWLAPEGTPMNQTGGGEVYIWKSIAVGIDETEKNANWAQINFNNSPLNQFTGSYTTNKGFLSDGIYLQDSFFYQAYSYVIRSDIPFTTYEIPVKQTVHPAGMAVFGELQINNVFDLSAAIQALNRYFDNRVADVVDTSDVYISEFRKVASDTVNTNESHIYELSKPLTETVFSTENKIWELTKPLTETVNATESHVYEFSKPLTETVTASEAHVAAFYKVLTESISTSESHIKSLAKPFSEEVVVTEDSTRSVGGKPLSSTATTSDSDDYSLEKPLSDTINTSDSGVIQFNPYAIGYFAEDYVSGITSF